MSNDFIDPQVAAYFASMQGTPAMALYQRWKNGETIRVRTIPLAEGVLPVEFEIRPERLFESGPVGGATILIDGKPDREHMGVMMPDSEFLDWCTMLEVVE